MKKLIVLSILSLSTLCFCADRFQFDDEVEQEQNRRRVILIENISDQLDHISYNQGQLVAILREINSIAKQYKVETHDDLNHSDAFDFSND